VLQLHRRLGDVVYNAGNACERVRTTVRDRKTALDEKLVTTFRQAVPARSFAGLKNTCYVNFGLFQ